MLLAAISKIFGIATGTLSINIIGISASFELGDDAAAVKVGLFPQIVIIPMTLVFAWFYAAASIKRLHDRNKSGWWIDPLRSLRPASTAIGRQHSWADSRRLRFFLRLEPVECLRADPTGSARPAG